MALVLNEEQLMLKDAARDFLSERAPVSHLREIRDSGNEDYFSRDLWVEMVEMGWTAILVPEEHGGLGYGFTGLGIVLEESGRTLTPSPLLGTAMTGAAALIKAGSPAQCSKILPPLASGESLLALACDENKRHEPDRLATEAVESARGFCLNGTKTAVLDGHIADTFIVSAWTGSGVSLFLVPAESNLTTLNWMQTACLEISTRPSPCWTTSWTWRASAHPQRCSASPRSRSSARSTTSNNVSNLAP